MPNPTPASDTGSARGGAPRASCSPRASSRLTRSPPPLRPPFPPQLSLLTCSRLPGHMFTSFNQGEDHPANWNGALSVLTRLIARSTPLTLRSMLQTRPPTSQAASTPTHAQHRPLPQPARAPGASAASPAARPPPPPPPPPGPPLPRRPDQQQTPTHGTARGRVHSGGRCSRSRERRSASSRSDKRRRNVRRCSVGGPAGGG